MQESGKLLATGIRSIDLPAVCWPMTGASKDRRTTTARERTTARAAAPEARASRTRAAFELRAGFASVVLTLRRWSSSSLLGLLLVVWSAAAAGHDLAIDQVMLWPDPSHGTLRGELTFDPELTRDKDVRPTLQHERQVVAFLEANVRLSLDGQALPIGFEVRELWVRGGATVGDLVMFSVPLPTTARELRFFASDAFKALVVSVQNVTDSGRVDTTSWLLGRGEWSPVYRFGAGWQQPGWRDGGPDVFLDRMIAGGSRVPGDAVLPPAVSPPAVSSAAVPRVDVPSAGVPSADETGAAHPASLAARFVRLGFEHILPGGIDHVLFVAGLVLGSARRHRQVLISLSLFTLAHTLTLALANFQVVQVPARIVEPLIALSIFLLGVDNLRARAASAGERATLRYGVVFGFGLIHGLGFASALSALAFGREHVVLALLSFNVGVELGQVAVVVLLGLVLHLIRERRVLERYATAAGSAAIAASGLFMVFERLAPVGEASTSMSEPQSCRYEV
jgi:hypothetical protein